MLTEAEEAFVLDNFEAFAAHFKPTADSDRKALAAIYNDDDTEDTDSTSDAEEESDNDDDTEDTDFTFDAEEESDNDVAGPAVRALVMAFRGYTTTVNANTSGNIITCRFQLSYCLHSQAPPTLPTRMCQMALNRGSPHVSGDSISFAAYWARSCRFSSTPSTIMLDYVPIPNQRDVMRERTILVGTHRIALLRNYSNRMVSC